MPGGSARMTSRAERRLRASNDWPVWVPAYTQIGQFCSRGWYIPAGWLPVKIWWRLPAASPWCSRSGRHAFSPRHRDDWFCLLREGSRAAASALVDLRPARSRGGLAGLLRGVLDGCQVRERAGDGGSAAGDLKPFVDVLQVGAHSSLGQAEPPGDLGVGVPSRHQVQQVGLTGVSRGRGGTGIRQKGAVSGS